MSEKKLADRIRDAIRLRGYSIRTEKAYVQWYERFVRFHNLRHPSAMRAPEVEAFLTHLVANEQVSASCLRRFSNVSADLITSRNPDSCTAAIPR